MAFINQLSSKLQELKSQAVASVPAVPGLPAGLLDKAQQARQNIMPIVNKCTQQVAAVGHFGAEAVGHVGEKLDALGKILQVNVNPKGSPIDLLPAITAFDPALENAEFRLSYDQQGAGGAKQLTLMNTGHCLMLKYNSSSSNGVITGGGGGGATADVGVGNFSVSFLPDEQYILETINFHWGNEVMNGSEHTVSGVGYAGELHFVHRNVKYQTMDQALKQPNGVIALAVFLNEGREDNPLLSAVVAALGSVIYQGQECPLQGLFRAGHLVPVAKNNNNKPEFWLYDGSETIEPFRETVKWVVFRPAVPISTSQMEKFRALRRSRSEDEHEEPLVPIRGTQSIGSRVVRSSLKIVAGMEQLQAATPATAST